MINPVQTTRQGSIHIVSKEASLIGNDLYHQFQKRIKLANGENLKTSPLDFSCKVKILTNTPNDPSCPSQITYLPSSLFKQARRDNRVLFYLDNIQYDLSLAPLVTYRQIPTPPKRFKEYVDAHPEMEPSKCLLQFQDKEELSFDDCIKCISQHNYSKEFEKLSDVPQEFFKLSMNFCRDCVLIQQQLFSLSPNTQRIYLEEPGAHPLDLTGRPLKLFPFKERGDSIEINVERKISVEDRDDVCITETEEGACISLACAGSGDRLDTIEILLDRGRLFIMIDRFIHQNPEKKNNTLSFGIIDSPFNPYALKGREIDTKNIIATRKMGPPDQLDEEGNRRSVGILGIYLPFVRQNTTEAVVNNSAPLQESTKSMNCTVSLDLGVDKMLGICCEPSKKKDLIVFTKISETEWQGKIPVGKDFKFAILDSSSKQVIAWEKGEDRHCNEDFYNATDNGSMHLTSDAIKFT